MLLSRPRAVEGVPVGIVTLKTRHEIVPGNVQHALSFDFPVAYAAVAGVDLPSLMAGDDAAFSPIMRAVEQLQDLGVDLIVGACGSFGHYQKRVAAAATVPVCMSILTQVRFLLEILPQHQKLGVVFARASAFTAKAREQCDIPDSDRIVIMAAEGLASFQPIIGGPGPLDSEKLRAELLDHLTATAADETIGAWLLQCSDLPPYAPDIYRHTGKPVFDMAKLIRHLASTVGARDCAVALS